MDRGDTAGTPIHRLGWIEGWPGGPSSSEVSGGSAERWGERASWSKVSLRGEERPSTWPSTSPTRASPRSALTVSGSTAPRPGMGDVRPGYPAIHLWVSDKGGGSRDGVSASWVQGGGRARRVLARTQDDAAGGSGWLVEV